MWDADLSMNSVIELGTRPRYVRVLSRVVPAEPRGRSVGTGRVQVCHCFRLLAVRGTCSSQLMPVRAEAEP
jgi:hypothetical protein